MDMDPIDWWHAPSVIRLANLVFAFVSMEMIYIQEPKSH